jgi:hypothetical protein
MSVVLVASANQIHFLACHSEDRRGEQARRSRGIIGMPVGASDAGRGGLTGDTVAKPQPDALAAWSVAEPKRRVGATNEAASATLLTPLLERYHKYALNGRGVFVGVSRMLCG